MSRYELNIDPPDRSGECERCDTGEVCGDCLEHPDKCECQPLNPVAAAQGEPADLPPLTECPDCDGRNYIED